MRETSCRARCKRRTALAVAAIMAAALAAGCSAKPSHSGTGGPTTSPPGPSPSPLALQSVDWAAVTLDLLSCGPPGPSSPPAATVAQVSYVQPDPDHQLAVVLASCTAGAGAPPDALYVFDRATSPTGAHLLQTLLPPTLDRLAPSFTVAPAASASTPTALTGQSVTVQEAAFSSGSVPDCCPDLKYPVTWSWNGDAYSGSPADRAAGYPITATVAPASVTAAEGDTVSFTVTVANPESVTARQLSLFLVSTGATPCAGSAGCTDLGLRWVSGTPGCRYDSSGGQATCTIGSLSPGASASVDVKVRVSTASGPLTFSPEVDGQTSGGRFLPSFPTATVTVTG
ncbi:MAG TPA: hypothetical protein VKY26_00355 [Actinomycetota bacterium]|nr:hypothetical protein [Actinomycetota bacterium]